jgi:catechol 2,3-dioxygenase-like lactoylglutathione lyase family enzyme
MRRVLSLVAIASFFFVVPGARPLHAADKAQFNGLGHVEIQVQDIEQSIRFYQDILQFVVVDRAEIVRPAGRSQLALVRQGSCVVELVQAPDAQAITTKGPIGHFAILVSNVDSAAAELKAKGITFDREPANLDAFGGLRNAFFNGPSGESIELLQFLNPSSKAAQTK